MTAQDNKLMFQYWGKADDKLPAGPQWHPLVYHSLDVAAVAALWWDASATVRQTFLSAFNCSPQQQSQLRAWVLFYVALHDLGKFDLRFQLKSANALAAAWRPLAQNDHGISIGEISAFDHGHAGIAWANREYRQWVSQDDVSREIWEAWCPWLAAVTGHHGDYHDPMMQGLTLDTDESLIEHDQLARAQLIAELEKLFLKQVGLNLLALPPACTDAAKAWLAGFCSICDWVGSNTDEFSYRKPDLSLAEHFDGQVEMAKAKDLLHRFGLLSDAIAFGGVDALLKKGESPRGVQVQIESLPTVAGMTLIEAPTGSGKTEAALAYAWRLLDAGVVDSIVFALPTQATANAMLQRAETFAEKVFDKHGANVVLAHGKSKLNTEFDRLVTAGHKTSAQGKTEAAIQCASWLSSSRKRVFLGQIGVCTVDQALLSVLPVRHKFVRGFGLNKSVLIVDEVHAYDAYMHGLLGEVLRRQKAVGGSTILLSATLPNIVRTKLLEAWDSSGPASAPYPALWHATSGEIEPLTVPEVHRPQHREIFTECIKLPDAFPDDELIARIIAAAEAGARVAVVMNLVDDAQQLARELRTQTSIPVDVFHARYRFMDRQQKEATTLAQYGREAIRESGRILVATQVVEQSLDLDFDWMLTQICPVDLLFQRLGRLHRHQRDHRPTGFDVPRCTALSVDGDDYGLHKLIYGNTRVLWRTEQLLSSTGSITFPAAYRDWIEQVYQRDSWDDEPDAVYSDYLVWKDEQKRREADALQLTSMSVRSFRDDDNTVTSLTRDGEMSLTVLPVQPDGRLLDGQSLDGVDERKLDEVLNFHEVPVPSSKRWKGNLDGSRMDTEGSLAGCYQLAMVSDGQGGWLSVNGKLRYSEDFGLEKKNAE